MMNDRRQAEPSIGFMQWQLDEALKHAFERLLLLHETPKDIAFLAPLIQQEIYCRLLIGEQGDKLKRMVSINSNTQKSLRLPNIYKAIIVKWCKWIAQLSCAVCRCRGFIIILRKSRPYLSYNIKNHCV